MSLFLGTHRGRLDAKGRISIPASFRAPKPGAERAAETAAFVLQPSFNFPCVECWPMATFLRLSESVERYPAFSVEHDDLASTLHAEAYEATPDREGRIVLPGELARHAGLGEEVVFMGVGATFQIWEPEAATRRREEARARARARGLTLAVAAPPAAGAAS